jgi:hypothetical protein
VSTGTILQFDDHYMDAYGPPGIETDFAQHEDGSLMETFQVPEAPLGRYGRLQGWKDTQGRPVLFGKIQNKKGSIPQI